MKKFFITISLLVCLLIGYSLWGGFVMFKEEQKNMETQKQQEQETQAQKKVLNFDGVYEVDVKTSEVVWTGKKKVIKQWIDKGTIAIKQGSISISNSLTDWNNTKGEIVFDMTTIASKKAGTKDAGGSTKLDQHLKSADFFNVDQFKESKFVLKEVKKSDEGFELVGDLTIKDVTKPVTLASIKEIHFVEGTDQYIEAQGQVKFNRTDFGVHFGSDSFFDNLGDNIIEDEVMLDLLLVAKKK